MTADSLCSVSEFERLIGVPWAAGAQGPDAYDCWAFASMVQERFFNRPLARVAGFGTPAAAREVVAARRPWRQTDRPAHGDMVECVRHGHADHVGVWLDIDRGGVLHCQRGAGACFDRLGDLRLLGWRPRFWTPGPREAVAAGPALAGLYVASIAPLLNAELLAAGPEEIAAAHRGIPLDVRAGDTVAAVLARAGIDAGRVMCFVRPRGRPVGSIELASDEGVAAALSDLGRVAPEDLARTLLGPDDVLLVQHLPLGGGGQGSDPLRVILGIVVLVAAAYLAGPLAGAIAGPLGLTAQTATAVAFSAISIVGNLAVNALLPPPAPEGQRTGLIGEISPTYSADVQTSIARPGAVIPVCLGRHIHLVDDASPPWSRYEANVQYLHQTTCLGTGSFEVHEVRLGATAIWRNGALTGNLPGISIEFVEPNQPVTLFEESVLTQPDVAGQQLQPSNPIGWHAATPPGIDTEVLEVDIGFTSLVAFVGGSDTATTVDILVEAQAIATDGTTIGTPFTLELLSFTDNTRSNLRSSHRYTLPAGRYQVRVTRQTADGGNNVLDDCFWLGLKAILPSGRSYGDVTLMALKVEVGSEIAGQTARQVSVIKTRKLPVWEDGAWTEPQATRSIAWAIAEIARMHGRLEDLDIDELVSLDATWSARGDTLDVVIDQEMSLWQGLQAACRAGRAQPDQIGSRIRIWRDEPRALPRQLFTERNIVRGSLRERPILPSRTRPDRLIVPFMDELTWKVRQIEVGPEGGRARQERYFGIANGRQLTAEISHDWRAARFRPSTVAFDVELEGRLVFRGDPIAITHRQLTNAQSVSIVAWNGRHVTLQRPIDVDALDPVPVLALATPDGGVWGPVRISRTGDENPVRSVVIEQTDFDSAVQAGGDPAAFVTSGAERDEMIRAVVGSAFEIWRRLIVVSVSAERRGYVTITGIEDDPRAHDAEVAVGATGAPQIIALIAAIRTEGANTFVDVSVSLSPATPADTIIYEYSTDAGASWILAIETHETVVSLPVPGTVTDVRAAGVAALRGPWVRQSVADGSIDQPDAPAEVVPGLYAADGDLHVASSAVAGADRYEWILQSADPSDPAVLRSTVQPELNLLAADLKTMGGPWREVTVSLRAATTAGIRSTASTVVLTHPAPPAPTGLAVANGVLTWLQPGAQTDVEGWYVTRSWAADITVTTPSLAVPLEHVWTVTIAAIDVVGLGPATSFTFTDFVVDR